MGQCNISGIYKSYDWKDGINKIRAEARAYYGDMDGYSGSAADVDFIFLGDKSNLYSKYKTNEKVKKELYKFIDNRLENLGKRDGEIIKIGEVGYNIITTEYREVPDKRLSWLFERQYDYVLRLLRESKEPAILVTGIQSGIKKLNVGTLAELKKYSHEYLRKNNYSHKVYIVGKSKSYIVEGKVESKEKTTRVTNNTTLVVPVSEFIYWGRAPE